MGDVQNVQRLLERRAVALAEDVVREELAGVALAYVWEDRARHYVESNRLVPCLADWIVPEDWLYLYYPTRRYILAGLRAVIDALKAASS